MIHSRLLTCEYAIFHGGEKIGTVRFLESHWSFAKGSNGRYVKEFRTKRDASKALAEACGVTLQVVETKKLDKDALLIRGKFHLHTAKEIEAYISECMAAKRKDSTFDFLSAMAYAWDARNALKVAA